ncbi:alpha/beta hydrolase [Kerstersia gyiorum]|uniref:alpha/beta hydrolase n=1 Tax=Kerstersia gyiorum TaxID=206506 RepID=UPI0010713F8F|nr:alpha/beta hydrolase [Kerstersia gyiorum]QBR40462.1 alpha/beta hydrolase [Kerstersia gyiorum]
MTHLPPVIADLIRPETDLRSAPPPALATWLAQANRAAAQARERGLPDSPQAARDGLASMTRRFCGTGPAMAWERDITAGPENTPVRLYDPVPDLPKPVCVYLHGGGHMAGSVAVYDPICRRLAAAGNCLVAAVDYRLAPEYPYPDGLTDCLGVLVHLQEALDAAGCLTNGHLSLAGDSGGGALAATLASLLRRHQSLRLDRLLLVYPSLDYTLPAYPSLQENGTGYLLETSKIRWYFDHYFQQGEDRRQASPLYMSMDGLPPTLVITAGLCPLRDEGLAYLQQLRQHGIPCQHLHLPDMIHACLNLHELVPEACERIYQTMTDFMHA